MKIAISGAGVAGPTLAYWLLRAGHEPVLIEQAPALRTGGYMIDFWGAGYEVARRMALLPELRVRGYDVSEVRFVGRDGKTVGGFSADVLRRSLGDAFVSLPRGDLASLLHGSLEDRVETIFGDSLVALQQDDCGVRTVLLKGGPRRFDVVVGADGLHSAVRSLTLGGLTLGGLTLGGGHGLERPLGYHVAAFLAPGYRPRDGLAYVSHAAPGRQVSRFALRGDVTMFLLVFRSERLDDAEPAGDPATKLAVRRVFSGMGWETPRILDLMDAADDLYFDRVSQVVAPAWSRGRVALVGDAASCVSLLGGEGAGLAMLQAYVLAGELAAARRDPTRAFAAYEARLRTFLARKQASARAFAGAFAPRTPVGVWVRNLATRLMGIPWVADRLIGGDLRDDVEVPEYHWPQRRSRPGR